VNVDVITFMTPYALFRFQILVSLHLAVKFVFWPHIKAIPVPVERREHLEWTNIHAMVSYDLEKFKIEKDKPVSAQCIINRNDLYTYIQLTV
jgi:hypothetical protein